MANQIAQGDQYSIAMKIKLNGEPVDDVSKVEKVEITLHNKTKLYPEEVTFSNGLFFFPITQEETFSLPRIVEAQVRIKFKNDETHTSPTEQVDVIRSLSKEIL